MTVQRGQTVEVVSTGEVGFVSITFATTQRASVRIGGEVRLVDWSDLRVCSLREGIEEARAFRAGLEVKR